MCTENHQWHYDYVRLAEDSGFAFGKHKKFLDHKPICLVDIDRVITEKDIATIERCIPVVVNYAFDPEQVKLLDTDFVNTFRLSQLSVEYLLFCKKYLDDTTVLLKRDLSQLRLQNKELQELADELKSELCRLAESVKNQKTSFKCEDCNKVFSTEEFLNAHKKRRHLTDLDGVGKLQVEIKELKGKLNSAEKIANEKSEKKDEAKFNELQKNLDDLKTHMEEELKTLKEQRQFEEKLLNSLRPMTPIVYYEKEVSTENCIKEKTESTTQTEDPPDNRLEEKKIEEILDHKVTSKLQNIETQMQAFFEGLKTPKNEIQKVPNIGDSQKALMQSLQPPRQIIYPEKSEYAVEKTESMTQTQFSNSSKENHKIEEVLDRKVTSKLQDIEQQIQIFFDKLKPTSNRSEPRSSAGSEAGDARFNFPIQPLPKPRTKFELKPSIDPLNLTELEKTCSEKSGDALNSVCKAIEDSVSSLIQESERFKKLHSRTSSNSSNKLQLQNERNCFSPTRSPQNPPLSSSPKAQKTPTTQRSPTIQTNLNTQSIQNTRSAQSNGNHKDSDSESDDLSQSFVDLSENEIRLIKEYKVCSPQPPNRLRDVSEILYETDEETSSCASSLMNIQDVRRTQFNKPSGTTLDKRSFTSLKKVAFEPTVFEHFKDEIDEVMKKKLKDLGVSPQWRGIPIKTYNRVLEIVNHQVALTKKNCMMYETTKNLIENLVHDKALKLIMTRRRNNKLTENHQKSDNHHRNPRSKFSKFRTVNRNIKNNINNVSTFSLCKNVEKPSSGCVVRKKQVLFDLKQTDYIQTDAQKNANNKLQSGETTSVSSSVLDDEKNN